MRWAAILFLFIGALSQNLVAQTAHEPENFDPSAATYLWPTNASSHLTSTFAETRSDHFHAALDIKTWGRRGYEVYATRDGIVDRIAIGPRGYGKVIYLKHEDGSYSVYAHLLAFNNELQQLADSIRLENDYAFEIDRSLSQKHIEVQQGEIIGYSGASGIGPPHLHFELRTPDQKPFNPLLTNLKVKDTIAPKFSGIAIEPLSPYSAIEGDNVVYTKNLYRKGDIYYTSPIKAKGPIGIAVDVFDQSNGVYNSYAVYSMRMSVDGETKFLSQVDEFSYDETGQMFLDRIYPVLTKKDDGYQRLYIADGNTLSFYNRDFDGDGHLNLKPGEHTITIEATDYFGNQSTASFNLNILPRQKTTYQTAKANGNSHDEPVSVESWYWTNDWVTIPENQFEDVVVAADSSDLIHHKKGITIDLSERSGNFFNIPALGPLEMRRVSPNQKIRTYAVDHKSFVEFPARTFYDTVSVGLTVNQFSSDSIKVDVLPFDTYPLRGNYKFNIRREQTSANTSKLSFYKYDRYDEDEEWELIPTTFSKEYITGEAATLGTFVTLRDTIPPEMGNPRLRQRPDKKWIVYIDISDNLSGIDYSDIQIDINGKKGIAEYEPEDDRVAYYHPNFTPSDSLTVNISASDKMGNSTDKTFEIISN